MEKSRPSIPSSMALVPLIAAALLIYKVTDKAMEMPRDPAYSSTWFAIGAFMSVLAFGLYVWLMIADAIRCVKTVKEDEHQETPSSPPQ